MKIIDLESFANFIDKTCITIGFFDGMHLGHQKIIQTLTKVSKENNCKSLVITFKDDVLSLFKMTNSINTLENKLAILDKLNVDYVLLLGVNDNFMSLSACKFIKKYLEPLNCQKIVCGSDFSFAKNKEGNIKYILDNTSYEVIVVDDVYINSQKISSTYIRTLLSNGKIKEANELLYQDFSIKSIVVSGKKIGRTIGFKTANIKINDTCKLLKHGVYFGKVRINNLYYKAMINVGYNPTIKDENVLKIEAHILDFNESIYNEEILIIFDTYHRDEIKFTSLEELKKQLNKDVIKLINY